MDLSEEFQNSLNFLFNYKKLERKVDKNNSIDLDNEVSRYMTSEGQKLFYEFLNKDISVDNIMAQNNALIDKNISSELVLKLLLDEMSGTVTKEEFSQIGKFYFTTGVKKSFEYYKKLFNNTQNI